MNDTEILHKFNSEFNCVRKCETTRGIVRHYISHYIHEQARIQVKCSIFEHYPITTKNKIMTENLQYVEYKKAVFSYIYDNIKCSHQWRCKQRLYLSNNLKNFIKINNNHVYYRFYKEQVTEREGEERTRKYISGTVVEPMELLNIVKIYFPQKLI